ncbi:MAG: AraC family transcriptional regulator [Selenomonadaceae bacterium]|nr:AraC family transcriptional regulator [Selenomonadaceae bacterium]
MYKSVSEVCADANGQEIRNHGIFAYPVACYLDDMNVVNVISHWHDELELISVTEGKIIVGAGQTQKILRRGDGCFINANVIHDVRRVDSEIGILHSIVFHPRIIGSRADIFWLKFLQPLIENKQKQFIFFDGQNDSETVALIEKAWQAQAAEIFGYEFDVRNFLSQIIRELSEGSHGKAYLLTPAEIRDNERVKKMIFFIEKHFAEDISLEQIAQASAISKSEAHRCFKRVTGLPAVQFLIKYRILLAAERLRSTKLNVSDIAASCGFLDMSYFSKAFREIFNVTPTDYRENLEMI